MMPGFVYRVAKTFEVESGHMLSKHPDRCRFPHGHTRRVEVVIEARGLTQQDMVVDFKALKVAVLEFLDRFDHAMCIHRNDPGFAALNEAYGGPGGRIIIYEDEDPTTEVLARQIFEHVQTRLERGETVIDPATGAAYPLPAGLVVRRVRLWETSSSWAEVEAD